jgi:hypothetical protein
LYSCWYKYWNNAGCRSELPRDVKRGSAAARLPELRIRFPPGAWMSLSC